jgi:hypothetical protein
MRAGLVANTFLEAMHIKQFKKKYSEYVITDEMRDRIEGCAPHFCTRSRRALGICSARA